MNCPICNDKMKSFNFYYPESYATGEMCEFCQYVRTYVYGLHFVRIGKQNWDWAGDGEPYEEIAAAIASARMKTYK